MQNDGPTSRTMFVNCQLYGWVIGIEPICHRAPGGSRILLKWMLD